VAQLRDVLSVTEENRSIQLWNIVMRRMMQQPPQDDGGVYSGAGKPMLPGKNQDISVHCHMITLEKTMQYAKVCVRYELDD